LDGWPIEPKISSIAENSVLWWFFRIFLIRIHVLYYIYKKIAKILGIQPIPMNTYGPI